jgi:hypothetical protein
MSFQAVLITSPREYVLRDLRQEKALPPLARGKARAGRVGCIPAVAVDMLSRHPRYHHQPATLLFFFFFFGSEHGWVQSHTADLVIWIYADTTAACDSF